MLQMRHLGSNPSLAHMVTTRGAHSLLDLNKLCPLPPVESEGCKELFYFRRD